MRRTAREVVEGVALAARLEGLVRTVYFGIGLLQNHHPELVGYHPMESHQPAPNLKKPRTVQSDAKERRTISAGCVDRLALRRARNPVINDDWRPLAAHPELDRVPAFGQVVSECCVLLTPPHPEMVSVRM